MVAVISFVIALVGIAIQLFDAFPTHREARRTVATVGVGVFIGTALATLLGAKYTITGNVDRQYALLFTLAGIGAAFGAAAVMTGDQKRREVAIGIASILTIVFVLAGFAVALGSIDRSASAPKFTTDELVLVATRAEQRGQVDRAIELLQELQSQLASGEARSAVAQHIRKLQEAQAGTPAHN